MSGGEIALLRLLQAMDRARFEPIVVLFTEGPFAESLRQAGVETHVLPLASEVAAVRKGSLGSGGIVRGMLQPATYRYVLRLRRFMRQRKAHIVHTNSLKADLIGGLAARLAGKPLVWHIRDRIAEDYLPASAARMVRLLCRTIPHRIIANSAATLETLRMPTRMLAEGVHRRAFVVHDGMPVQEGRMTDEGRSAPNPLIGLIGRITPWKGQHVFLDAAALVYRAHPEARFLIVGSAMFEEGDYERQVRSQCTKLGLDDVVEFTGFRDDVPQVLAGLTVLVHASVNPEPFGQVVLEGMMAQKPVVATRAGGVVEVMVDGETGILVPVNDAPAMAEAILRLLDNPDEAARMARAGRRRAETMFSIERTARGVEAVYDHLLKRAEG
jgi:glycosyltransferase involved in cell wall biosynthesis